MMGASLLYHLALEGCSDTLLIENPAAVLSESPSSAADFLTFLTSPEAQADYALSGFRPIVDGVEGVAQAGGGVGVDLARDGEGDAGTIGDAGDMEYTAIGHTVGLAQRMESLAEPGKAYLTQYAARLAAIERKIPGTTSVERPRPW